ncbi:phosphomannomutase/phosphoglucomutase [Faunimonas sp. B44]|uniref:phosphomannomutase/phosphoglucomutase n=1 Tax=Faunimonas sp. B44 TaxID=3461493 RepID=UPI004043AFD0
MFPRPQPHLRPNSYGFETVPLVRPAGFREYDARWLFGAEINLMGVQAVGLGLGTFIHEMGVRPEVVIGHDFRSYSASIKLALAAGLMAAGVRVHDIGLALTPMAYFAQFALDVPAVAMVTASHNENGWTGVKMGVERPLTFGPDEMTRLKAIVLEGRFALRGGGGYVFVDGFAERYVADLAKRPKLRRRLKVVAACGNGTAGAFAPRVLEAAGAEVVPLDCELDHGFPRHNPNPEDLAMLQAIREAVLASGADVGLGFDGDGDRCGIVDEEGEAIYADKVGVLLARDIAARVPHALFIADVKSTGLFASDPVLQAHGARTEYWKTGHSYIKERVRALGAVAGFEKSGHYFFNAPIGRGYDDALVSALAILDMLDRNPGRSLSDLRRDLPQTWGSPTMSPHCDDDKKYQVVERVLAELRTKRERREPFAGGNVRDIVTVNGVRVVLDDGTWGLVRASSNKPELTVVVESPVSEARMRGMFAALDDALRRNPEVGAYNQTL